MKFIAISDTHNKHAELKLPSGDALIHAGDMSMGGNEYEILAFLDWIVIQNFQYKILIAGNHDFFFERESNELIQSIIPKGVIYLNDSGIEIGGLKIWGSPITPWFFNWAFNRHRGEPINRHWDLIPDDTDILVTHGPVFRILDKTMRGEHVGCKDLDEKVLQVKPKVHICGHIHEAYGTLDKAETKFINAGVVNERYIVRNKPVEFELPTITPGKSGSYDIFRH